MMLPLGGVLTVAEAAKALKLSPQRVRYLLAKGRLRGFLWPQGGREVWCIHESLERRPGTPGRPKAKRRKAAAMDGGSAAKP
jgi:hypothetical protein